jgi:hypothetical protein
VVWNVDPFVWGFFDINVLCYGILYVSEKNIFPKQFLKNFLNILAIR